MNSRQQQLVDRVVEAVDGLGLLPCEEQVLVLDVLVSRLQARQADALAALGDDAALPASGCATVGSWARLHLRRGASAHRLARRAVVLPELPLFAAAFAAGRVTDEHVDTVIRWTKPCGLATIQDHQQVLLELARNASARELEQALELLADLARPDRDADKVAALAGRFITISGLGDLVRVDAMVEPALGEALKTAVEAGAARPPGLRRGADGRTAAQRRADAFGEIVLAGIGAGLTPHPTDTVGTAGTADTGDPVADHTGTAGTVGTVGTAGDTAGTAGAGVEAGGRARAGVRSGRLRPQVALTVSLEYLAGIPGAPRPLLDHFGVLPAPTVHRLICDAALARVVLDTATGLPLDVGRSSRLAVNRQRRALATVFRHCAFPGCRIPFRFTEVHHVAWWSRGGDTDLRLLVPYCWTHHHFLHEGGFTVQRRHGRLIHRRPDRQPIPDPDQPLRDTLEQLKPPTTEHQPPPDRTDERDWPP